ncbi:Cys-tRNA(Pro) deacylase [Kocuria sp.]|uniref:Cys-tRNA(Pro) deacylase n=1 Tax=Kocuria sp. TaxID=1871328 RepID=UPI0026DFCE38|nr:Cys-tRNA(Pro) deacylase [Kocuria sp.]MDO5619348.1 Cys-tRNA(Pro) deacylase [Kocuria sp.]
MAVSKKARKSGARSPSEPDGTAALRFLTEHGVVFSQAAYHHDDAVTDFGAEAAQALGVPPDRVFKTLVVSPADHTEARGQFGVVVLPVDRRVAMKAAAAALGWKKAALADAIVAARRTGYVVGGISPFGQKTPSPTVLDASALNHGSIYVSGGRRGLDVEVAPQDLITVLSASVAEISSSPGAHG